MFVLHTCSMRKQSCKSLHLSCHLHRHFLLICRCCLVEHSAACRSCSLPCMMCLAGHFYCLPCSYSLISLLLCQQRRRSMPCLRHYTKFWFSVNITLLQGVYGHTQVNDGSTLSGLQVVVQPEVPGYELLDNGTINTGAAVRVQGELVESPGRNQKVCTAFLLLTDMCRVFPKLHLALSCRLCTIFAYG